MEASPAWLAPGRARRWFRRLLGERLPLTSGVLTVDGLDDEVRLHRDRWHVPHIYADSAADAFYGLGFAQGQDRAFQLEVFTRLSRGRLAELIGPDGLPMDRLARRIGFGRLADAQVEGLPADQRAVLDAFARGASDGATVGSPRRAHELALLRAEPTPLRDTDVLAALKLQTFLLAANWEHELARLKVLIEDGEPALIDLDPIYGEHLPVTSPPGRAMGPALDRLADDLAIIGRHLGASASNNWAVAGARTASGRPLVANDPHLPPLLPPMWYLAHLVTPEWSVAGACLAGSPGFAAAHNGFGAWGATSGHTDNTDLFLEEVGPDGRSVRDGDDFIPCEVRREEIPVRFGRDVVEEVLITPRGPIVSPALFDGEFAYASGSGAARRGKLGSLSMRGVWMDATPGAGMLLLPAARSFADFRAALADSPAMQLNLVWGDVEGHIGWQLAGQVPRRRKGWGTIPLPGWDPSVGWEDELVPYEALPHLADPDAGFVATANNRPVAPSEGGAFLGVDFLDGYRQAAIVEALDERDDWDVDATMALQQDVRSLPWRAVRDALLAAPAPDVDAKVAQQLLSGWDGLVTADSPAAAVYELVMADLAVRVAQARAPRAAEWFVGRSFSALSPHSLLALRHTARLVRLVTEQPDGWFDGGWPHEIGRALTTAGRRLRGEHGDDPRRWRWGQVRPLRLRHLVSDAAKPLRAIFDRGPIPLGGDAHTIPQASVPPLDPTAPPYAIASVRMVVDVGDWEACRWALPGGQSGNPVSPHYDDQLERWAAGRGVPIPWSDDAVAAATVGTLRLLPAQGTTRP